MKFSKKEIVQKLVIVPNKSKRAFWAKQMSIFNKLLEKFPSEDFWRKVQFDKKYEGMEYLFSPFGLSLIRKKYRDFHYKVPPPPEFIFTDEKIGESPKLSDKPKNIREFLS